MSIQPNVPGMPNPMLPNEGTAGEVKKLEHVQVYESEETVIQSEQIYFEYEVVNLAIPSKAEAASHLPSVPQKLEDPPASLDRKVTFVTDAVDKDTPTEVPMETPESREEVSVGTMVVQDDEPDSFEENAAGEVGAKTPLQAFKLKEFKELEGEEYLARHLKAGEGPRRDGKPRESAHEIRLRHIAEKDAFVQNEANVLQLEHKFAMTNGGVYKTHLKMINEEDGKQLYTEMRFRQDELTTAKTNLQPLIAKKTKIPVDKHCKALHAEIDASTAKLKSASGGQGGAYFGSGVVVKPKGEGIGELHNRKGNGYVLTDNNCRVRDTIPLYQENEREAASYEIAVKLGLEHITPPTIMTVLENPGFGHISDRLDPATQQRVLSEVPRDDKKICTVQKMIPDAKTLLDIADSWEQEFRTDFEAKNPGVKYTKEDWLNWRNPRLEQIDFVDYENCNILQWTTGENDGNEGNFMLYAKPKGQIGLCKIDNGLAFPERNQNFKNDLPKLSQGAQEISERAKAKIRDQDPKQVAYVLREYGLRATVQATEERMHAMKRIIEEFPKITHREMSLRLSLLAQGGEAYLRDLTPGDVNDLKGAVPSLRRDANSRVQQLKGDLYTGQQTTNATPPSIKERKEMLARASIKTPPQKGNNDTLGLIHRGRVSQRNDELKPKP